MSAVVGTASPRILSLEDQRDAIAGPLHALENDGCVVERCASLEDAEAAVRETQFDLLLVDQRVPRCGRLIDTGGTRFVHSLARGSLGELNRSTPFLIVTADVDGLEGETVESLPAYVHTETKDGDLTPRLRRRCSEMFPEFYRETVQGVRDEVLIRVLGQVGSVETGIVRVVVPAWDPAEEFAVRSATLPDSVQVALDEDEWPLYLRGRANLMAASVEELELGDFDLAFAGKLDDDLLR